MRILHVHSGNLYGGVESMLRSMARCSRSLPQHQPVFALCHEGRIAPELRAAGCEVHLVGEARASHPFSILKARAKIAALCRASPCAATVVHSPWALALLAPGGNRPIVLYQHDAPGGPAWTRIWSRRNRPDLVIANSRFIETLVAQIYPKTRTATIYPCVELTGRATAEDARLRLRRLYRTPVNSMVLLQASRFESWKGHQLLLDALATLRSHPHWILWVAGAPQRPAERDLQLHLQAEAQRYGVAGRVVFLGHVDDVPALMHAADIYCQPNTGPEAFGLTFVEALHAGLTVIGTALGGDKEILHPDWGVIAEPTAASVAAALRRCLDDDGLRRKLAEKGPSRARMLCHPPAQIEKLENAISALHSRCAAA